MSDSEDKKAIDDIIKGWLPGLAKVLREGRQHSTYCAVLQGLCGSLGEWRGWDADIPVDERLDAQVKILQRVAARAAERDAAPPSEDVPKAAAALLDAVRAYKRAYDDEDPDAYDLRCKLFAMVRS